MRKIVVLLIVLIMTCSGCGNYQMLDTTYGFEYAYIYLPDGRVIEGNVESWRDYEDGDQLQVTINGKTYLTHASNVVLVHTREEEK